MWKPLISKSLIRSSSSSHSSFSTLSSLSSSSPSAILSSLCRGNKGILVQKLGLMDLLIQTHNPSFQQAQDSFCQVCPIVGASVGQHFRHSMDHLELAVLLAHSTLFQPMFQNSNDTTNDRGELHYDLRVRGGTLETDLKEAHKRVLSVMQLIDEIQNEISSESQSQSQSPSQMSRNNDACYSKPVDAYFMLGGDPDKDKEVQLSSTIGRELGFAAHHAIHHMAMVKVIAIHTLGIKDEDLPMDFGRAPSTVQNDKSVLTK